MRNTDWVHFYEGVSDISIQWAGEGCSVKAPNDRCLSSFPLSYFRPPVSRAPPRPEKLQTNNVGKKKRPIEVRRTPSPCSALRWIQNSFHSLHLRHPNLVIRFYENKHTESFKILFLSNLYSHVGLEP